MRIAGTLAQRSSLYQTLKRRNAAFIGAAGRPGRLPDRPQEEWGYSSPSSSCSCSSGRPSARIRMTNASWSPAFECPGNAGRSHVIDATSRANA